MLEFDMALKETVNSSHWQDHSQFHGVNSGHSYE